MYNSPYTNSQIKDFLKSNTFLNAVLSIGKSTDLHIDQIESLRLMTERVILGDLKRTNFIGDMRSEIGIEKNTAITIVDLLNTMVFEKIRGLMQEESTYEEDEEESEDTEEPTEVDESHRDSILSSIESPAPVVPKIHTDEIEVPPEILPKKEVSYPTNWMFPPQQKNAPEKKSVTEPKNILDEQVQTKNPIEQILRKPTQSSTPQNPIIRKQYTNDPYRELPE